MRKMFLAIVMLLCATSAFAQTNPCALSASTTVYNPAKVYVQISNFNETLPGTSTPSWNQVQVGIFNNGVNPTTGAPVSSLTATKTQLTLVSGTTDCYAVTQTVLASLPVGALQFMAAKIQRTTPDIAESPWSANSNPFARPAALSAPVAVRVTQ